MLNSTNIIESTNKIESTNSQKHFVISICTEKQGSRGTTLESTNKHILNSNVRALALEKANAISKENLAFTILKSSTSENCKGKYCKFFAILATVQF